VLVATADRAPEDRRAADPDRLREEAAACADLSVLRVHLALELRLVVRA
jgi:hypothetical protein